MLTYLQAFKRRNSNWSMASLLADAIASSARAARGFLGPLSPPPPPLRASFSVPVSGTEASKSLEIDARIEAAIDETLEYHRTHRPANTARNYAPKQREWKVSSLPALEACIVANILRYRSGVGYRASLQAGNTCRATG